MTICQERGNIFKQSASRSFTSEISGLRKQYGMRGWRNWQTRTFEVRVVYPWGFESPPSHQKASRFLTCLFFYEQKWWNGRHAGFRHQFLVSEGSSPFFCITWKPHEYWKIRCSCGFLYLRLVKYYRILTDICTYLLSESLQKVCKLYRANLRESPLKWHESPHGCVDRLFCGMV